MSMLTRKGTMVRKNRGSVKRPTRKGTGSLKSVGSLKYQNSPSSSTSGRREDVDTSSPRHLPSTVVCYDEEKELCMTSLEWRTAVRESANDQAMYGSVYIQMQEAKKDTDSAYSFVCRSGKIICQTVFVTVLVGISMVLPLAMISVGVKYLNECPVQRKIPIYLLVGGCFGVIKVLGTIWLNMHSRRYEHMDFFDDSHESDAYSQHTYKLIDILLSIFLISWLITGSYWVFSIWKPNFKQILHEPSNWCDKTVYMFAAYQIIGCFSFFGLVILVSCCLACCFKFTRLFDDR